MQGGTFKLACAGKAGCLEQPIGDFFRRMMASEVVPVECLLTTKQKLSRELVKARNRLRPAARCLSRFPGRAGSVYDVRHQMHNGAQPFPRPYSMPAIIRPQLSRDDESVDCMIGEIPYLWVA